MGAAWRIAGKDLLLRMRDRSAFIIGIAVPLLLAFVFNLVFGGAFGDDAIATMGLANGDQGEVAAGLERTLDFLVEENIIDVVRADSEDALRALVADGEVGAGISVPAGLSAAVEAGEPVEVTVIAEPDSPTVESIARGIVTGFATSVADAQRGVSAAAIVEGATFDAERAAAVAEAVVTAPPVAQVSAVTAADRVLDPTTFFAASMAVFFVFFMVQFGVIGLLDEEREGTLVRLQSAPIPRWSVVVGKGITSVVLGMAALTVLAGATTVLMGADWGNPLGVGILIVAVVLAATSIIGVVAAVARTSEGAANLGAVIAVALGMLGGTFFPVAGANRILDTLALATPHAWFLRGLGALSAGEGLTAILPAVGALLAFGVGVGVIAALLLGRRYA